MKKYTIIIYVSLLILLVFPIFIYADNDIVTCTYSQNSYTFQIRKDGMLTIMGGPAIQTTAPAGESLESFSDIRKSSFLTMFNNNSSKCPTTIYHCEYKVSKSHSVHDPFLHTYYTYDICSDSGCMLDGKNTLYKDYENGNINDSHGEKGKLKCVELKLISSNYNGIEVDPNASKTCEGVLGDELTKKLTEFFNILKIVVPILVIALSSFDFAKSILNSDSDSFKNSQITFAKRLVLAVIFFLLPIIINLSLINSNLSTCI